MELRSGEWDGIRSVEGAGKGCLLVVTIEMKRREDEMVGSYVIRICL